MKVGVLALPPVVLVLAAPVPVLLPQVEKHSRISNFFGATPISSSCASLFNSSPKCLSPSSNRSQLATPKLHNSLAKMKNNSSSF